MTSHKKPGMAFWATVVVVVLPFLYAGSFGPMCWITSRIGIATKAVPWFYKPIIMAMAGPKYPEYRRMAAGLHGGRIYIYPPEGVIERYSRFGAVDGWRWRCASDLGFRDGRVEQLTEDEWEWADATGGSP